MAPSSTTVSSSAPLIDRRVGANLHVMTDDDRGKLLNLYPSVCTGCKTKAVCTNRAIRMNRAALANVDRVANHRTGLDHRVGADAESPCPTVGPSANPDPIAQHHVSLNTGAGINRHLLAQPGTL